MVIRPHFSDGKASGLVLTRIRAGSIFFRLGLKNGDIIYGLNGRPVRARDHFLAFHENLKPGSRISLEIERKGRRKRISYDVR